MYHGKQAARERQRLAMSCSSGFFASALCDRLTALPTWRRMTPWIGLPGLGPLQRYCVVYLDIATPVLGGAPNPPKLLIQWACMGKEGSGGQHVVQPLEEA